MDVQDGETPLGFVDEAAGDAVLSFVLQHSCLPLFDTLFYVSRQLATGQGRVDQEAHSELTESLRSFVQSVEAKAMPRHVRRKMARVLRSFTQRKTVATKVRPVDTAGPDSSTPDGDPHWREKRMAVAQTKMHFGSEWDDLVIPRFTSLVKGARLTEERLQGILNTVQDILTPQEVEMFTHILYNREASLAWEFSECGRIDPDVVPPQVIRTIPHSAWQTKGIPIPKPLVPKVIDLLWQRLQRDIIEESHASYRNNWFLVLKKDGGLRLINDAQRANAVTIRDAFVPPAAAASLAVPPFRDSSTTAKPEPVAPFLRASDNSVFCSQPDCPVTSCGSCSATCACC